MPISTQTREDAARLIARYAVARSALLPLLHLVQAEEGYVSEEGVAFCASTLGLTKAEVAAVATFYTMFKREPFGQHLVSVCTNPTCKLVGGSEVLAAFREACGGSVDRDAGVMVEEVECLGSCDAAPVIQVNYETYARLGLDEATALLEQVRAGEPPASNLSGAVPRSLGEVHRELSGIDDSFGEQLEEAARLQAAAPVPPAVRSGETDIPVTHPGGDPAGHGGAAFRAESGLSGQPLPVVPGMVGPGGEPGMVGPAENPSVTDPAGPAGGPRDEEG